MEHTIDSAENLIITLSVLEKINNSVNYTIIPNTKRKKSYWIAFTYPNKIKVSEKRLSIDIPWDFSI